MVLIAIEYYDLYGIWYRRQRVYGLGLRQPPACVTLQSKANDKSRKISMSTGGAHCLLPAQLDANWSTASGNQ